eukprot:4453130-Prymnesium_polylepis.1
MSNQSRPLRGWRSLCPAYMPVDPLARDGGHFQEIPLDARCPSDHLVDAVLLLPEIVTPTECSHLITAANDWIATHPFHPGSNSIHPALTRVECHTDGINLDGCSHALATIIMARALWNLEVLRPDLAEELFQQRSDLGDMWVTFSSSEP